MKRILIILATIIACSLTISAKLPKLKKTPKAIEVYDTIASPQLRFSGYEKPNAALRETFLVTNLDTLGIDGFAVELDYYDMEGRQLHQATRIIKTPIPAGETRLVNVATWDRNHTFHYFRSPAPVRRQSTPYQVKSKALYSLRLK